MPHTTSAKKALRQTKKRRLQNRAQLSALKTLIKGFRSAIGDKELAVDEKEKQFRFLSRRLDQAGAKNLIHRNAASRLKSRLRLAFNKTLASAAAPAPVAQ